MGKQKSSSNFTKNKNERSNLRLSYHDQISTSGSHSFNDQYSSAFSCLNSAPKFAQGVLFIVALVSVLSSERVLFKVNVDRLRPFRFVLMQEIVLVYLAIMFVIVSMKRMMTRDITAAMAEFPRNPVFIMAALDLLQLTMTVMGASQTSPVMTVVLLQSTTAFSIFGSCISGRAMKYRRCHYFGMALIFIALSIAIFPALYHVANPAPTTTARSWNVLVYFLAGIPAALSSVYKERHLVKFALPMDPYYLNMWLALYQMCFVIIISPLSYKFQCLGHSWSLYPQSKFSDAINEGWDCGWWGTPFNQSSWPQEANCHFSFLFVTGYVGSTVLIHVLIDKVIMLTNEQTMYRAVTLSIVSSCLLLALYTMTTNGLYFPDNINIYEIASILTLGAGLEMYHWEKEPDSDFLTQWIPETCTSQVGCNEDCKAPKLLSTRAIFP